MESQKHKASDKFKLERLQDYRQEKRSVLRRTFTNLGDLTLFTTRVIKQLFTPPYEHRELIRQSYFIGNKSFLLIAATGLILGIVLTLQAVPIMSKFGAQAFIPPMVTVSVLREIGPVVTGLIAAGKVGSGIAAEIGSMRVGEQLDAMEVSGTRPLGYVVASRVLATTLMLPILVIFSYTFSLFGAFFGMNLFESMSFPLFLHNAFDMTSYKDIVPSLFKSIIFGFSIGIIGAYKGYHVKGGTEAVGRAANSAVVISSISIFLIDLIAVMLFNIFGGI